MKLIYGLIIWLLSLNVGAAIYAGGLSVDGSTHLIVTDTETRTCVVVSPNTRFSWITEPGQLLPILDFVEKYNISDAVGSAAREFCDSHIKYYVAKNWWFDTRPMRDTMFGKTPHRIAVGRQCENRMIKPYSSTDSSRGYLYATNAAGFRGLVVCKKGAEL